MESIKENYLHKLKGLILKYIGRQPIKVYLYGSRAKGTAHRTSDVDIALLSNNELPTGFIAGLKEMVEESSVPYQVDIVDLNKVDDQFRKKVLAEAKLWKD